MTIGQSIAALRWRSSAKRVDLRSALGLHVGHALVHGQSPRGFHCRGEAGVAGPHRVDQGVDKRLIHRRIDTELPMTVSLGHPRENGRFPIGLVREDEQQAERVLQELVLPLEVRIREQRLRRRAAAKEVAIEILEEVLDGTAPVVARLGRRYGRLVELLAAPGHAACLASVAPLSSHSSRTPPLATLTAWIDPPCSRVTAAARASPSPVPVPRVRAWSAR